MSWGADLSKSQQQATTSSTTSTAKVTDAFNKTFSYVYAPSTTTTTTTGDAESNTKMLVVAGIAGLLILLGVVAARS